MAFSKKRSGSEKRRQCKKMSFRVDDAEKAAIETEAARQGLTPGSYIRSRALAKPTTRAVRRPPVETAQLAQLLGMLGAVGGTIRALAEKHSAAEVIPTGEVHKALAAFRDAAEAILQVMGKRPALARDRSP
jgi:hypothetical protein